MSPRTLRNALMLAGEAQRQIRAAGRTPPPLECLLSVLLPYAKLVTRAARAAREAERHAASAQALARECAAAALEMADAVIEATPAAAPQQVFDAAKCTPFDASKHTVQLVAVPGLAGTRPVSAGDLS